MLDVTYSLNFALMIGLPLALAFFLTRRFGLSWGLVGAGALTFVASQVVHIPLVFGWDALAKALNLSAGTPLLVANSIILGLLAGLCEELARYVVLAWFLKKARTWGQALVFGIGHGGVEAVMLGLYGALILVQLMVLRTTDLSTLGRTPEEVALIQQQVTAYWSAPWYTTILGAVERVFTLCLHLSLSVMVMRAFTRRNNLWLWAAIGWHALVDAVAVFAASSWGIYWTEALIAVSAVISVWLIFRLRADPAPETVNNEPAVVAE